MSQIQPLLTPANTVNTGVDNHGGTMSVHVTVPFRGRDSGNSGHDASQEETTVHSQSRKRVQCLLDGPLGSRVTPASKLPVPTICDRCGYHEFVDHPIHRGQSTRRDCAKCRRTLCFPVWYGETQEGSSDVPTSTTDFQLSHQQETKQ